MKKHNLFRTLIGPSAVVVASTLGAAGCSVVFAGDQQQEVKNISARNRLAAEFKAATKAGKCTYSVSEVGQDQVFADIKLPDGKLARLAKDTENDEANSYLFDSKIQGKRGRELIASVTTELATIKVDGVYSYDDGDDNRVVSKNLNGQTVVAASEKMITGSLKECM